MKISIEDKQKDFSIDKAFIRKIVKKILDKEKIITDEIIFHFVTAHTIKKLHKDFFNDPSSTDCISFPIDGLKSNSFYSVIGEAFICPKVAIKYAKKNKLDVLQEIILYLIHCILHLIGYNDIKKEDIKQMRKKENELLLFIKKEKLI